MTNPPLIYLRLSTLLFILINIWLGFHILPTKLHLDRKLVNSILLNPNTHIRNKLLLYKTVLCAIILYACPVWGFASPRNQDKIRTTLRPIGKASRYLKNDIISREFKIDSIRNNIKTLAKTFYNSVNNIHNNLIKILPVYDLHQWKYRKQSRHILTPSDPISNS